MKVGAVQTSPVFGNTDDNVSRALELMDTVDADLVVLPELFSTGYQFTSREEVLELSEEIPSGRTVRRLMEAAKKKDLFIAAGLAERDGKRAYNSSVLVGPSGFIGLYRKAHLFADEKRLFDPGDTPFEVHDIGPARVGMMICFDWVFPEAARTLALKGADIICHPSNLVLPYCPAAMITRSIENRVFTITANRVGEEHRIEGKRLRFIGRSQITSPDGGVLYSAPADGEAAFSVEIEPLNARRKNITPENDIFRDRRKDLYELD